MKSEDLLAHADFVRKLARRLVFDPNNAADVSQQAWVAALEHPPSTGRPLRPWLHKVVQNLTRNFHRGVQRRRKHEQSEAAPETIPSTADIIEREETRKQVVQAVVRLEEPYLSAIVLRYYEDLPPREVARRLDVPLDTARSRIKRGLEQLRARLDGHFGNRKSWCLALAPLAGLKLASSVKAAGVASAVSTVSGGVVMGMKVKVGIAAAVVLGAAFVIWHVLPEGPEPPSSESVVQAEDSIGSVRQGPSDEGVEADDLDIAFHSDDEREQVSPSDFEAVGGPVTWRGTLRDLTGESVRGVEITSELDKLLCEFEGQITRSRKAVCGEDGSFEINWLLPGRYDVKIKFPNQDRFQWGEMVFETPGLVECDITLKRGMVRGVVIDGLTNAPIVGKPCFVYALTLGAIQYQLRATVLEDGQFILRGLHPSSRYHIGASGSNLRSADKLNLQVEEAEIIDDVRLVIPAGGIVHFELVGLEEMLNRDDVELVPCDQAGISQACHLHYSEEAQVGSVCLAPGKWLSKIWLRDSRRIIRSINVVEGSTTEIVIHPDDIEPFQGMVSVNGSLKYPDGKAVSGAAIHFWESPETMYSHDRLKIEGKTDEQGHFYLDGFRPGTWGGAVKLRSDSKQLELRELYIENNPPNTILYNDIIHLGKIKGKVVRDKEITEIFGLDGSQSCPVRLMNNDVGRYVDVTRSYDLSNGNFELTNVPPGTFVLKIQPPGHTRYTSLPFSIYEDEHHECGIIELEAETGLILEIMDSAERRLRSVEVVFPELGDAFLRSRRVLSGQYINCVVYTGLPPGAIRIRIKAEKKGLGEKELSVNVLPGVMKRVRVVLERE